MTGLIVVDESGDLGSNGSRFFSMAALVMFRSRYLKNASKMIPNDEQEHKWSNTEPEKRKALFEVMNQCNFDAVYSVVEKRNPKSKNAIYGNLLYENTLRQVLSDAISILPCKDFNIIVDRSSFIPIDKLRKIAFEVSVNHGVNLMKCEKVTSSQNKCIQLVDYVAGASRAKYEEDDDTIDILKNKVSIARRY